MLRLLAVLLRLSPCHSSRGFFSSVNGSPPRLEENRYFQARECGSSMPATTITSKSELVFAIDRANEGGYELFYDDFKKHTVFQFYYH
jgi:hypothetical protein